MEKNDNAFKELLLAVVEAGGSDLHLSTGRHPTIRVAGSLVPLVKKPVLTSDVIWSFLVGILNEEQQGELEKNGEVDFAYSTKNEIRFRCNAFRQRNNYGMAMRLVPNEIGTLEELGLPEILKSFALKQQGFFLVVGPAGHGKSTTLASMVKIINQETSQHIVTIEDPIEYLFIQDKSIIDQREVGHDTTSFKKGLRSMFRQDVDVAMIGEMRDADSIGIAVTAAETGHLILSSLHTNNASQTIDRIIDSFPASQQNQTRLQLAGSLLGIFSQRLIPRLSGGLIPAYELLIANTAVRNLIRERRTHELDIVIETSSSEGMIGLNTTLLNLVRDGEIGMDDALAYSLDPKALSGLSN